MEAVYGAAAVWEQSVLGLTWYHGIIAAAYLGAAWLCFLNGHIAKNATGVYRIWFFAAAVLCVQGANTVLHGDLLVTQVLRSLAILQGWYGERRQLQYLTLVVMVLAFFISFKWLRARFTADQVASGPVALGVSALLLLLAVRTVSAHATDAVINQRLAGVSAGRLLEFAGIGLVLHGAVRNLRFR